MKNDTFQGWLTCLSAEHANCRVFVRLDRIEGVLETMDGHSRLLLKSGHEVPVRVRAIDVMAGLTSAPETHGKHSIFSPVSALPLESLDETEAHPHAADNVADHHTRRSKVNA